MKHYEWIKKDPAERRDSTSYDIPAKQQERHVILIPHHHYVKKYSLIHGF